MERYTPEVKEELSSKRAGKVTCLRGLRLYECPLSYVTEDTAEVVRAVTLADASGHLLYGGGWVVQPYWFVEAYEIFKAEILKTAVERNE